MTQAEHGTGLERLAILEGALAIQAAELSRAFDALKEAEAERDRLRQLHAPGESVAIHVEREIFRTGMLKERARAEKAESALAHAMMTQRTPGTEERCVKCNASAPHLGCLTYGCPIRASEALSPATPTGDST